MRFNGNLARIIIYLSIPILMGINNCEDEKVISEKDKGKPSVVMGIPKYNPFPPIISFRPDYEKYPTYNPPKRCYPPFNPPGPPPRHPPVDPPSPSVVPEPISSLLFLIGGATLGLKSYLRRKDKFK